MINSCEFCERGIISLLEESEFIALVSLEAFEIGDLHTDEKIMGEVCEDCETELSELAGDLTQKSGLEHPVFGEDNLDEYDVCSFCSDDLESSIGIFGYHYYHEKEKEYVLCERCRHVIAEFLNGIPENSYTSEVYTGPPDLGWLGHQWMLEMDDIQEMKNQLSKIEALHDAIQSGGEDVYEQSFGELSTKINKHHHRCDQVWMNAFVNSHGVVMSHGDFYYSDTGYRPEPDGGVRDIFVHAPARRGIPLEEIVEAIHPQLDDKILSLRASIEESTERLGELEADMKEYSPGAWDIIDESQDIPTA